MTDHAEQPEGEPVEIPTQLDHRLHSRKPTSQGKQHPEEVKALALSVYAETGSATTAAEMTGLPKTTIHNWVKTDPDIDAKLDALRTSIRARVAHTYAEIARRGAEELLDRVNNGDYHIDKQGNVTRRPIPGRELAFITSIATDKHTLLTGQIGKTGQSDQTLTHLANKLVDAIKNRDRQERAVDAEPSDD